MTKSEYIDWHSKVSQEFATWLTIEIRKRAQEDIARRGMLERFFARQVWSLAERAASTRVPDLLTKFLNKIGVLSIDEIAAIFLHAKQS